LIKTELKYKSFYHGIWQNRYLLKDLLKLSELFRISLKDIYDNVITMVYRGGAHRGKNSNPMKLPQNFEDFFYLAGLFIGDGHNKKFIVGKEELRQRFVDICDDLGITLTFRTYDRTPEIVTNQTLMEVLNSVFGYPKKHKSKNVKISEFVNKSDNKYVSKLLKGYFDTDGTVEKSRRAVSLTSASPKMIEDLQMLLPRFGCVPIIYDNDDTVYLSGKSMSNFMKEIGFGLTYKSQIAQKLIQTSIGSTVSDNIPMVGQKLIGLPYSSITRQKFEKITENLIGQDRDPKVLSKLLSEDLAFIEIKRIEEVEEEFVYDFTVADNHNFVAEGMIIHNTTFSDNLLAGAGMISEELAGQQLVLDFHEDEQERGITIDSANVNMVHDVEGKGFLINLIDTPGHVDFGGDVTRAMRAVDGAIVLVDAVEGMMPQTETVFRQALKELVKPVLFINKVDRLIKEVKLTPEQMQQKFITIIDSVNELISKIAPEEKRGEWQVSVQDGSVAFGSAIHNWALSFPYMQKNNITFKDIIDAYIEDNHKELAKKAPLHKVVLNMSVEHHPNPVESQKYRIPKIWHGDKESEMGKNLIECDPKGGLAFVVTKIVVDKHAGEIAAGRLFSGTIKQGGEIFLNGAKKKVRVQQLNIYKGAIRVQVDEAVAGNIIGIVGLRDSFAGETISDEEMEPFEAIKHIFEPVVTKAIEAKKPSDLPKLIEVLRQVNKEDPTVNIEINEETGEHLMHGMGELHLEVIENRIKSEKGVEVETSPPLVVYRETITKQSGKAEGKTPNKHNIFIFSVEPLSEGLYGAIKKGEIPEGRFKKKDQELWDKFISLGIDSKEARKVFQVFSGNMMIDNTRGIVQINEVIDLIGDGFEQVMKGGPLAREPCDKVLVRILDMKLHEDAIHRGPAQVYPAVREGIRGAMDGAETVIFEPLQTLQIDAPEEYLGELSKVIQNKRGQLLDVATDVDMISVKCKLPVAEMFGFTSDLRSATGGRGSHFLVDQGFERLPRDLQDKVVKQIKQRKGMKVEEG
jgi:elongation factor 2